MATKSIRLSDGTDTLLPESAQSASGYQKCADGTLICWGTANKSVAANSGADFPTIFPIAFNANPIIITDVIAYVSDVLVSSPNGVGKTGFTGRVRNLYTQDLSATFYWIAIGRWK